MENELGATPEMVGETVDTTSTTDENTSNETPIAPGQVTPEKTYTRSQIETMMKRRVERSHNSFFNRYGVKDLNELDALFEKTKTYDSMQSELANLQLKNAELSQHNAFLRNNINPNRYDDIKAYFKGSDREFNEDTLIELLTTHPEWLNATEPKTTIERIGSEAHKQSPFDEKAEASKFLGVNL